MTGNGIIPPWLREPKHLEISKEVDWKPKWGSLSLVMIANNMFYSYYITKRRIPKWQKMLNIPVVYIPNENRPVNFFPWSVPAHPDRDPQMTHEEMRATQLTTKERNFCGYLRQEFKACKELHYHWRLSCQHERHVLAACDIDEYSSDFDPFL